MPWLWRTLSGLVPWCAVIATLGLLLASEALWSPLQAPGTRIPATAPTTAMYETAGLPYRELDGPGRWNVCVANHSGQILPPFVVPGP